MRLACATKSLKHACCVSVLAVNFYVNNMNVRLCMPLYVRQPALLWHETVSCWWCLTLTVVGLLAASPGVTASMQGKAWQRLRLGS